MRKIMSVTVAAVAALLCGCGGDEQPTQPDVAACKAAMKADYERALATPGAPSATRPPACNGVDDATLERIVGELLTEVTPPEPTTS